MSTRLPSCFAVTSIPSSPKLHCSTSSRGRIPSPRILSASLVGAQPCCHCYSGPGESQRASLSAGLVSAIGLVTCKTRQRRLEHLRLDGSWLSRLRGKPLI